MTYSEEEVISRRGKSNHVKNNNGKQEGRDSLAKKGNIYLKRLKIQKRKSEQNIIFLPRGRRFKGQ